MYKLAVGLLAATLALAACGGSSKKSVNPAGNGATVTTTKGGSSSSASDDLSKLAGQYAKAKIKITYTSSNSGSTDSTLTLAQDGNGKTAFTTSGSTLYYDGKKSIACQGTGTSAHCTDMSSLGSAGTAGLGASITGVFAALANILSQIGGGDRSSETIAGRDASCVKYKASDVVGRLKNLPLFKDSTSTSNYDPNDTLLICVDKSTGFLLKVSGTQKGKAQDELTATAVTDPTDADFTPPVTPETMPSIPGGITIPSIPAG